MNDSRFEDSRQSIPKIVEICWIDDLLRFLIEINEQTLFMEVSSKFHFLIYVDLSVSFVLARLNMLNMLLISRVIC
jgi:hypothetical protein